LTILRKIINVLELSRNLGTGMRDGKTIGAGIYYLDLAES